MRSVTEQAERATAEGEFHFSPRPNRAAEIAWRPWGERAFQEAQGTDKPVLLAISAVWCHWCHVMDETSYSDPEVIKLVNDRYVAVRVDNDQRPDVNRRYNMGGWPTTAFLPPDGEVIHGGTYVPPEAMRPYLDDAAMGGAALREDAGGQRGAARRVCRGAPLVPGRGLRPRGARRRALDGRDALGHGRRVLRGVAGRRRALLLARGGGAREA